MKVPQINEFKWGYVKMQIFRNFAFTNPGNALRKMVMSKIKFISKDLFLILNLSKIVNMIFLDEEICTKTTILQLGATWCPLKSIITAQIHVKLILPFACVFEIIS